MQNFAPILNKLGVIKNQLLIFIILAAIIISIISMPLAYSGILWKEIAGVCLDILTAFMLLGFGVFYAYALISLPANEQQLVFLGTVEKSIGEHNVKKRTR